VLRLQFKSGENVGSRGLTGEEIYRIEGLGKIDVGTVTVVADSPDGSGSKKFQAQVRIDTPQEWAYFRHGGILHYVVRQLMAQP